MEDHIMADSNQLAGTPREETNPRRRSPWGTVEGRVISLVSRKGGVGKTTSAVNLGAALALTGHSVLVLGTDPQCGVSRTLNHDPRELEVRLTQIFQGNTSLLDLVTPSALEGLHFLSPAVRSLEEEEEYLDFLTSRIDDFCSAVDQARFSYDTILIDCPPSLGAASRAALLASDSFLVPVQAEELCRESLGPLMDFIDSFRDRHFDSEGSFLDLPTPESEVEFEEATGQPLELEGLFLTMVNERTRMGKHVSALVSEEYGDLLFNTSIPRTTRLSEMALRGKPAVIYDRRSKGSRAYFDLADELVNRYRSRMGIQDLDPVENLVAGATDESSKSEEEMVQTTEQSREGGGLDRFLNALGGASAASSQIPSFEEPQIPEMVSLDDLLAEEEAGEDNGNEDWDDGKWPGDPSRLN
jgi:chromosome partitioning protein